MKTLYDFYTPNDAIDYLIRKWNVLQVKCIRILYFNKNIDGCILYISSNKKTLYDEIKEYCETNKIDIDDFYLSIVWVDYINKHDKAHCMYIKDERDDEE